MKKIIIIYNGYLDESGRVTIGGVQSYLTALMNILSDEYTVKLYEISSVSRKVPLDYCTVYDVRCKKLKELVKVIESSDVDLENDLLIFGTDFFITKSHFKKTIAIQHGIAWDITNDNVASFLKNSLYAFKCAFRTIKKMDRYRFCNNLVCVDYNFINWYRTQVSHVNQNIAVIPNYSVVPEFTEKINKNPKIVFARRFYEYRGTRLFVNSIKNLIQEYPDLDVTIAGEGPDADWIINETKDYKNIHVIKYESKDSLVFHSQFDIAVVPTKGSEGTSLSLLEAMASGCAVIGTNVGGITNILIDGYNGLLINPNEQELTDALKKLISDSPLRKKLSINGYEIVKQGFSYEKWKNRWLETITNIRNN